MLIDMFKYFDDVASIKDLLKIHIRKD